MPTEEEFQYVVEKKPPARCCFGSTIPRSTAPIGRGLTAFQRREAPEVFPGTAPGCYDVAKYNTALDTLLNKVRSAKGVGGLASEDVRFKEKIFMRTPSPTRYNVGYVRAVKSQQKAPFGSSTRRFTSQEGRLPGPGTYPSTVRKCRRTRFMNNFGNPTMIPTIEIICTSKPSDICVKCCQICEGDYWHKDHLTYLCHLCWEEEKRTHETYDLKQLKSFEKMRNCSFVHRHEGTTAAIRLLSPRKIKKKLRLENYLDLYINC